MSSSLPLPACVDDDDDVGAQPAALAPAGAPPLGAEVMPCLVKGYQVHLGEAVWSGVEKNPLVVAAFQTAHAQRARDVGLSSAQRAAESMLFDCPAVWGLGPLSLDVATAQLCNAVHFLITSLSSAEVLAASQAAMGGQFSLGNLSAGSALLSTLPKPSRELAALLQFVLNVPDRCNAWVFCAATRTALLVCSDLDLDVIVFQRAMLTVVERPTEEQKVKSRQVCFWCGAPPIARDTKLYDCGRCRRVAYCSENCAAADWQSAHFLECCVSAEHPALGMTRRLTEVDRHESLWVKVAERGQLLLERCVVQPPVEMGQAEKTYFIPFCFRGNFGSDVGSGPL